MVNKPVAEYTQQLTLIAGLRILIQKTGSSLMNHIELDTVLEGLMRYETDVVNNLTTTVPNKVLDARQGAAIKALIDAETAKYGVANGLATLDAGGKILTSVLPSSTRADAHTVATQVAMLALDAAKGDVAIRTDLKQSFILSATPASTLGNWVELGALKSYTDTLYLAHENHAMPHRFTEGGVVYKYGLAIEDGEVVMNYEEAT